MKKGLFVAVVGIGFVFLMIPYHIFSAIGGGGLIVVSILFIYEEIY